jgi:uncharacterized membrane protein
MMNKTVVRNGWYERTTAELTSQRHNWRQHLGTLLPLLLIYLALACYRIDYQSLWLDEVLSVQAAASTASAWKKFHGPLYFLLLHVWTHIGTSELVLRLLSVLFGVVAVCLFYATCLAILSRRGTILGTTLFVTSPFFIWYSQETRYITLMLATALLTIYTFFQLSAHGRLRWWLAYCGAVMLALFSFVNNIFLLLAQGVYLVWSPTRRPLLRTGLVCLILILVPFGWKVSGRFSRAVVVQTTISGEQRVTLDPKRWRSATPKEFTPMMIPYTFFAFSAGYSLGPSVRELHISRSLETLMPHAPTLIILGGLFGSLFLIGLVTLWRQPDVGRFLTLWIAVPIIGTLSVSVFTSMAYNARYVSMVFPAFVIILAAGIVSFRRPVIQKAFMAAVLVVHGVALANYYFNPVYSREDTRAAIQYLESEVGPRDVVLGVGNVNGLKYYSRGNLPIARLSKQPKSNSSMADEVQQLSKNHDRLWLVEIRPWQQDPTGKVKAALNVAYNLIEQKQFPGVDIYCYRLSQ